jgi:hypothetical protein
MAGNWKKGMVSPNPKGKPRGMSPFQIKLREAHDDDEMNEILKSIYRGEPFVRIIDMNTGMPRLAERPVRSDANSPGLERPKPASLLKEGERIAEIVYPTMAEQLAALKMTWDYKGYKPSSEVNMTVEHSTSIQEADLEDLDDDQLDQYLGIINVLQLAKAKNANAGDAENEDFSSGSHILDVPSTESEE